MHLYTGVFLARTFPHVAASLIFGALICPFELWSNFMTGRLFG